MHPFWHFFRKHYRNVEDAEGTFLTHYPSEWKDLPVPSGTLPSHWQLRNSGHTENYQQ